MVQRRGRTTRIADGPGKLCQALGITGAHNGTDLSNGEVRIEGRPESRTDGVNKPRIGITASYRPVVAFPADAWRLMPGA